MAQLHTLVHENIRVLPHRPPNNAGIFRNGVNLSGNAGSSSNQWFTIGRQNAKLILILGRSNRPA